MRMKNDASNIWPGISISYNGRSAKQTPAQRNGVRWIVPVVAFLWVAAWSSCSNPVGGTSTISGRVVLCSYGLENVEVAISGKHFGTVRTMTDCEGAYAFYDVWNGTYSVTLSKKGIVFTPARRSISASGGWIGNQDFVALPTWERTIGGTGAYRAYSIRETMDCGFVIVGYRQGAGSQKEALVVKLDSFGTVVWEKSFGDSMDACAYDVDVTPDGGYVVAGSRQRAGSLLDFWILRLDGNGDMEPSGWSRTYGGAFNDEAYSVRRTSDDGYVAAGYTVNSLGGMGDMHVIRVDASGSVLEPVWPRTYGSEGWDAIRAIRQTSDGGFIAAGYCATIEAGLCVSLMKLDPTGNVEWSEVKSVGEWDEARSVEETDDGGYMLTGFTRPSFGGGSSIWVMKTDSIGTVDENENTGTWLRVFDYEGTAEAYSVRQCADGGFAVSGAVYSPAKGTVDALLIKLSPAGERMWERSFSSGDVTTAYSVEPTHDGGFIVAGYVLSHEGRDGMWIVKLDARGVVSW